MLVYNAGLDIEEQTARALVAGAPLLPTLGQSRLSMELASLFSHGAAAPAAALLWRFRLLDVLLPLHAAHMQHSKAARKPRCAYSRPMLPRMPRHRKWAGQAASHKCC